MLKALRHILLLVFLSYPAMAQKNFSISVFGLPQRTYIYNKLEYNDKLLADYSNIPGTTRKFDKYPSYTIALGLMIQHQYTKHFAFNYGFIWSPIAQSYRLNTEIYGNYFSGRIRLSYLKLPLMVQVNFLTRKKLNLNFAAGPQLSMLLTEDGALPIYDAEFKSFDVADAGSVYKDFTFDLAASSGMECKLKNKLSLISSFRADISINDTENKNFKEFYLTNTVYVFDQDDVSRPPTHNITLGLMVGLKYYFRMSE